ncbi:MAG: response regulator [Myxococcales bacterium]
MIKTRDRAPNPLGGSSSATNVTSALLADDDEDSRRLIAGILRRAGFEVIEASDGQELIDRYSALRAERAEEPAVVVSDIGMPGCDGISATQVLRSNSLVPIVLITAFEDAETLQSARSAGADLVLFKPVDGASLVNAVRSVARQ